MVNIKANKAKKLERKENNANAKVWVMSFNQYLLLEKEVLNPQKYQKLKNENLELTLIESLQKEIGLNLYFSTK